MFWFQDRRDSGVRVDVAFTDSSLDLQGLRPGFPALLARVEGEVGVPLARLNQVHGDGVVVVEAPMPLDGVPSGDALVTTTPGLGLMVRVADCVPVVLADPDTGVVAAVHAGRPGLVLGVVTRALERMRDLGASDVTAWVGPHVCGACYEVPEEMRADVCAVVPETYAETSWGTPALDIGAGVRAQLAHAGVRFVETGGCTRENARLHSYRRDGAESGRLAGLVWMS